jgi:hypothetical protein
MGDAALAVPLSSLIVSYTNLAGHTWLAQASLPSGSSPDSHAAARPGRAAAATAAGLAARQLSRGARWQHLGASPCVRHTCTCQARLMSAIHLYGHRVMHEVVIHLGLLLHAVAMPQT